MSLTNPFQKLRLPALLVAAVACALLASGCASLTGRQTLTGVSQDELSAGGEPYFNVGPVTYQIQSSRELNPYQPDDVQYFAGLSGAQQIAPSDFWFGVFLWAKNQSGAAQPTADTFKIVDSSGASYSPVALNQSTNPYAWSQQTLDHNQVEPDPGSTAGLGPNGGGLILFKLPYTVYDNRPLTLDVYAPGATTPSQVSLDL